MGGKDQPGPSVRRGGLTEPGCGPAERLLEQTEGVFQVEAAEKLLPEPVDIGSGGVGAGLPEPDRLGLTACGKPVGLQPDHGPLDNR